jgi:preprotein translocase subunit SecE
LGVRGPLSLPPVGRIVAGGENHRRLTFIKMAQNEIQTVSSTKDKALIAAALIFALGGAVAYQILSKEDFFIRLAVVLAGVALSIVLFLVSPTGKRFVAFAKDAVNESKRVVWPTRKEGMQMTGVVFVFALIMSIYLLAVDKTLEWVFYDLILGWAV